MSHVTINTALNIEINVVLILGTMVIQTDELLLR